MAATTQLRRPQQGRAQRTRAAIVSAAAREFSAHGYAATTAKSIAKRAKVATGSVYQYFPNKDAILHELARARAVVASSRTVGLIESAEHAARASVDAAAVRALLRKVAMAVIELHRDDPGLHAVLTERRHADPELDALVGTSEAALVDRVAALLRRWGHGPTAEATAFVLFSMLEGTVHGYVLGCPQPRVDDDAIVDALTEAMFRVALPHSPRSQETT